MNEYFNNYQENGSNGVYNEITWDNDITDTPFNENTH